MTVALKNALKFETIQMISKQNQPSRQTMINDNVGKKADVVTFAEINKTFSFS